MNKNILLTLLVLGIILVAGCTQKVKPETPTTQINKQPGILTPGDIKRDIVLQNDGFVKISDNRKVSANIILKGNAKLIIEDSDFEFQTKTDIDKGIYLYDNAELIVKNSKLHSTGHMYEIELRNNAKMISENADIIDHSAIKLFDNTKLNAKNGLIDELRMDNKGQASLENVDVYMNMQYYFQVNKPIVFPEAYENIPYYLLEPAGDEAWKVEFINSKTQGWQVDVYPGTEIIIKDSTDVNLGLRSNGRANSILNINNPSGERINDVISGLGFKVNIKNSEIYFINLYLKGKDDVKIVGTKEEDYNLNLLEIVLLDDSKLHIDTAHLVAQLAHANDNAEFFIDNSLVGSTDPDDPITSELAAKDEAFIEVKNSDLTNTDVLVEDGGYVYIENCVYDEQRFSEMDDGTIEISS